MFIYLLAMGLYAIYLLVYNHKHKKALIEIEVEKNIMLNLLFAYYWTDLFT